MARRAPLKPGRIAASSTSGWYQTKFDGPSSKHVHPLVARARSPQHEQAGGNLRWTERVGTAQAPPTAGTAGARPGRQGDGSYKGWSSAPLQMDLLERDG